MFGIRRTFGHLIGRAAAKAFNQVVAYLDNFCADESIDFHRPDSPSAENPPCIGVNKGWLAAAIADAGVSLDGVGTNKLIGTDANAKPKAAADLPTSANSTYDKVLAVMSGGTALSWQSLKVRPFSPTSPTSRQPACPGTATAATATYTSPSSASAGGLVLRVCSRVTWDGTSLYGFYRDITFDAQGRLYSAGGEVRYTIDTPTKVTWS